MNARSLNVVLVLVIITLIGLWINTSSGKGQIIDNLNSQLKTYRNKDGQQVARIDFLEQERTKDFLKLETQDSTISELQSLVERYKSDLKKGGSATIIKTVTKIDTIIKQVEVVGDSIYPTYIGGVELGEWVSAQISANKDSIDLSLNIRNDYSVVFGREKTGFLGLGKRQSFAEVTNHNPYTETEAIRTYSVKPLKQSRWGLGTMVGYGISTGDNNSLSWFVGAGLSYQLIKF